MARGPKRRCMVFVDYSALRDTLRKNPELAGSAGPHVEIDFREARPSFGRTRSRVHPVVSVHRHAG